MLIHITPCIYLGRFTQPQVCYLSDLTINELGLKLHDEKELVTRRPYPNKHFHVACRKKGKKAMSGILIDSSKSLNSFTVESRWVVSWGVIDYPSTLLHRCTYIVLDNEFDAVTDNMTLWYRPADQIFRVHQSRWPKESVGMIPMRAEPRMDIWDAKNGGIERQGDVKDTVRNGKVIKRTEIFRMPSVEPEVLTTDLSWSKRIPGVDLAFRVGDEHGRRQS